MSANIKEFYDFKTWCQLEGVKPSEPDVLTIYLFEKEVKDNAKYI